MWLPVDWLPADMHGKERLKDKIAAVMKVLRINDPHHANQTSINKQFEIICIIKE